MWAFDVVMHHRICGVDKLTIAAPLSLFKFINFRTLNRTKQKIRSRLIRWAFQSPI